jgi:Ser/Thr protein kinase RdoA (MazF antagonist)
MNPFQALRRYSFTPLKPSDHTLQKWVGLDICPVRPRGRNLPLNAYSKMFIQTIMRQYGYRTERIRTCHSYYRANVAYRITTDRGYVLLKPYRRSLARLQSLISLSSFLRKKKFTHVPRWHYTLSGKGWVRKNRLFYVEDWIEGSLLDNEMNDYYRLGRVLAKLHSLSKQDPKRSTTYIKSNILDLENKYRIFRGRLSKLASVNTMAGKWFRRNGSACNELAEEAFQALKSSKLQRVIKNENSSIIHGDVTRFNVICTSNKLFLIDIDQMRTGSPYMEIVKAMTNTCGFNKSKMEAFLDGYESKTSFTTDEKQLISALFLLPREAWSSLEKIIRGVDSNLFEVLTACWGARLSAVKWLKAWAKVTDPEDYE